MFVTNGGFYMRKFLCCRDNFAEKQAWQKYCWVNIEMPTEEDTLYLTRDLKIPSAFLSDIRDVDERPRIETEDGWTLMILRIPYRDEGNDIPYITVPLGIIMKADYFVTICHHATDMLPDFIRYMQRKKLPIDGSWDLLFRLVFFITSLRGNDNLLVKLKNLKSQREFFDPDLVEDVEIELRQAQDTARIYSDILSGTMDAFASVISNNLNVIMKRMTAISLLLMIPTLIASLYGMNVHNGLEDSHYGLFVIAIISVAFSILSYWMFRRKSWL